MTAAKTDSLPADAPSHESVTWHAIDWRKTLGNVRRLQARIVKATQAGKWHKVRALQRLLNLQRMPLAVHGDEFASLERDSMSQQG